MLKTPEMKEMLFQPKIVEQLLMQDPRVRSMIKKNPEIEKMFQNPESMKEMMEMMTNPDYQKHMQNSMDRALINLNAVPGGFDAMKHVYHLQKPLFEEANFNGELQQDKNRKNRSESDPKDNPTYGQETLPNPWSNSMPKTSDPASLTELKELGFLDEEKNKATLERCNGNLEDAIEELLLEMEQQEQ